MELKVLRTVKPTCTLGELLKDGVHFGYTLEDIDRYLETAGAIAKVQNETAIPLGRYKVIVDYSMHFGKNMCHILDVPFYSGVRIHGGNNASQTEGCLLLGTNTNGIDTVSNCKDINANLIDLINREYAANNEVWIDAAVDINEIPYVIAHELFERNKMTSDGVKYEEIGRAHV